MAPAEQMLFACALMRPPAQELKLYFQLLYAHSRGTTRLRQE